MSFALPKSLKELMHSEVALVTGTALLTTAVLCSYHVMQNADGQELLAVAVSNLALMF